MMTDLFNTGIIYVLALLSFSVLGKYVFIEMEEFKTLSNAMEFFFSATFG
jgi:hypothetical protein